MSEEKASAKTDTAKPAKDKPAGESSASTSSGSGGDGSSSKNKSATALEVSYFSSVSSDEYRSGWEDIFGGGNSKSRKNSRPSKAAPNGPITVQLGNEDLTAALLRGLEAALRKKAKKDKIKLGRRSKSRQLNWRVTGEISG